MMMTSKDKCSAYKNIVGQFVGVVCSLSPFLGLLFMQSSINAAGGLGLVSNSVSYAALIVAVFFAPLIVGVAGTKYSLILSSIILTIYTVSNFYPHWYTLIPSAGLTGLALGLMWVAMYSHATATAQKYHKTLNNTKENCSVLLASATGVSIQLSGMVGASVSSVVLFNLKTTLNYNETFNNTAGECGAYEEGHEVVDVLYYPLIGIYTLMNIISIFTIVIFLDNFKAESVFISIRKGLYESLKSSVTFVNIDVLLLFPMFILHGLLLGYIAGDFSKVHNTNAVVHLLSCTYRFLFQIA